MIRNLLILFLLPLVSAAQITFEKNLGDSLYQDGRCVLQTADGGFLISGRGVDATGRYDILLMKTDSLGNLVWTKTWGGLSSDFAETIKPTADGGFIMSATTYSFSSQPGTNSDWWIFRFDANGDTLWTRIVNNIGNDRMYDAIETSDGSILGCGWISLGGYARGTIRKFSSTGVLLHTFSLGSAGNSYAQSVKEIHNGHYMLVGSRLQTTFGADLVELDTALNYINDYFFNLASTGEIAQTLERLPQGGYMLSAKTGYILNRFDIWLLRLNDQFDTLWTRTITQRPLSIDQSDEPYGFTAVADSGYLLCGQKLVGTSLRAIVYRLDTSGNVMWTRDFGGAPNGGNRFWWPVALSDGGFIFAGEYVDSVNFYSNVYLVRTDGQGFVNTSTTGIAQLIKAGVPLFPNPVSDRLQWREIAPGATVELYTLTGQLVHREKIISSSGSLSCGQLAKGIYACLIREDEKVRIEKIIVE
ncbi:MAG: hypothetical protein RIQ47_1457 [Bacteroidota bacterium]|jgi:hypothetical protein